MSNLRFPIYATDETRIVLKKNKIIIKMHKKEPLIWKTLQKETDFNEVHNNSLEMGCMRMIETLRRQGDKELKQELILAEKQARKVKY